MNCAVEMCLGAMGHTGFHKDGSGIQKLIRGTYRQHGSAISLL
jgi:hypothetical protein